MNKRVALVIGNARYRYGPELANPHKDAETIAGVLERLGFELTRSQAKPDQGWHTDLDLISMKRLTADFSFAAERADMAVVYFAGHGMEVDGQNYLLPVDAELEHVRRVRAETASLQEIVDDVCGAATLPFIILDACRDNPFLSRMRGREHGRSFRSGVSDIKTAGNLFVAYAAHQGGKAQDGPYGGNSPFAKALAEHLETPDTDIRILMGKVRDAVRDATKSLQLPHIYGSLGGEVICLKRSPKAPPPEVNFSSPDWSAEWERIKDSTDLAALMHFANHAHPYYAGPANSRIVLLEAEAKKRAEAEARAKAEAEARRKREEEEARRKAEAERLEREQKERQRRARIVPVRVGSGGGRDEERQIEAGSGESFKDAPFAPEMVVVPAGEYMMGSPAGVLGLFGREAGRSSDEGPQHRVNIGQPFAVGCYAVTFAEWDAAQADKDWQRITGVEPRKPSDQGWGRGDRPVINVSWEDAQAYVKWLQEKTSKEYRLLSEAEWEYAARAGTTTPFWWGKAITPDQANYDGKYTYDGGGKKGEYRQKTVPVKSFQPNPWGLYQVHGNVWEWVEDCKNSDYNGAPSDGSAWTTGDGSLRVLRGGSWVSDPGWLRAASRYWDQPVFRNYRLGFRVSRTLPL